MPRGYVTGPSLTVPTDPAFYDQLAGGMGEGILEGVSDVAKGAFSYVQNKQAGDQREKIARQLLASLIEDGVPPEQAKMATLEFVQNGTQELMKAWQNRKVVSADLKAKEAGTAQMQTETAQIAPNAEASRSSLGASTALTQAQTADSPEDTGIARMNAETGQRQTEGDLSIRGRTLDAQIDKETRDFVLASDADASGSIDPKEARDLLTRNRAAVREKVRKAKMQKADAFEDSAETNRYRSMTSADIDEEAKVLTREQIDDINFGKQNAMDMVGSTGQNTGGGTAANTYEQAVEMIERLITDPAQKQKALADAKAHFGRP
jgi:hypothetical protein